MTIIGGIIIVIACSCIIYVLGHRHGYADGKSVTSTTEVCYEFVYPPVPKLDPPTKIMPDKPGMWRLRKAVPWSYGYGSPRPRCWQSWEELSIEVIDHKGQLFCADDGQRVESRDGRWLGPCAGKEELKA